MITEGQEKAAAAMQHRLLQRKERKAFSKQIPPPPPFTHPGQLTYPSRLLRPPKEKPNKFVPFPHYRKISPFGAPPPRATRGLYSPQKFQIFQTFLPFLIKHESSVIKLREIFTSRRKNTCFPATYTLRFSNPSPSPRFGWPRRGAGESQEQIKFTKGNPGRKRSI